MTARPTLHGEASALEAADATSAPRLPDLITDDWFLANGVAEPALLRRSMRPEDEVASLAMMRAAKSTRLSFSRLLTRRMIERRWRIEPCRVNIDASGAGQIVYKIEAENHAYCFAVFSRQNGGAERSGAVSEGNNFDFFATLFEGDVDDALIASDDAAMASGYWRARTADMRTFGWTLANRSLRAFDHVVNALVNGRQPDEGFLNRAGGYLIRNAGYYANGRHGSRANAGLSNDNPLKHPYFPDLLALYMWRVAAFDIAEATARAIRPDAMTIAPDVRRRIGVGNTSGLGMVANVLRWPAWIGAIQCVREIALAFAMSRRGRIEAHRLARFRTSVERAAAYYAGQAPVLLERYADVDAIASGLRAFLHDAASVLEAASEDRDDRFFWREISDRARHQHPEVREQVHALIIEAEGEFADAVVGFLPQLMLTEREVDPFQATSSLLQDLKDRYAWALEIAGSQSRHDHFYWFRSSNNGENLRAVKEGDPDATKATFVDVPEAAIELEKALSHGEEGTLGRFLLENPQFYHMVSRVQLSKRIPYTEVRGNVVDEHGVPGDIIRFFLAALGLEASQAPLREEYAVHLIRGVFYQGAPLPEQISAGAADPGAVFAT